MAKYVHISDRTLRRIVKEDLIQNHTGLNGLDEEKHKYTAYKVFVCSDEKLFTVEAVVKYKNDRIYATLLENFSECVRTHFNRQK